MIYVITGMMASGKSTVAELLAKEFSKSVHLRGDSFRRMIRRGREEMSQTPSKEALKQLDLRYRLTAQVAKEYHKSGFTVIAQDNYYGEKLPLFLEMLQPEPARPIILCPDINTIRQRESGRHKDAYTGFDIERLYQGFMASTPRIGIWVDSSRQTPEETVCEILKGIG